MLGSIKDKLRQQRRERQPPDLDDKVLTAWNALTIAALARSGRLLRTSQWVVAAQQALDFLRANHWDAGRLIATSRAGVARHQATVDDYALLLQAVLESLQARWRESDLEFAIQLADTLVESFEDTESGGFFFTAHDHEKLIQRSKTLQDDATPSGAAVAIEALACLGHLLSRHDYLDAAQRALNASWGDIERSPLGFCSALIAATRILEPPEQIIVRGALSQPLAPRLARTVFVIPIAPSTLDTLFPVSDEFVAYRCWGMRCDPAVRSEQELFALMDD